MKRNKSKEYDMVKSVLPSRAAKQAKYAKDKLHRLNRHQSNAQCKRMVDEDFDDIEENVVYYAEPHRANLGGWDDIVYERRNADHLNHFEAWAYLRTKEMRQQDKLSHIRSVCPMGLLGYHAMGHLERTLGHDPVESEWYIQYRTPRRFRNKTRWNGAYIEQKRQREIQYNENLAWLKSLNANEIRKLNHFLRQEYNVDLCRQFPYARYELKRDKDNVIISGWWITAREQRINWAAKHPVGLWHVPKNAADFVRSNTVKINKYRKIDVD